jgi:hypothetical protein
MLKRTIRRFVDTWRMLLLHPGDFVKQTADDKRVSYLPALAFLTSTLLVVQYLFAVLALVIFYVYDPGQPTDLRSLFIPTNFIALPCILSVGIETFLFYALIHNWLGHKWAVRTTTPFTRIFKELLYIQNPIIVIGSIVLLTTSLCGSIAMKAGSALLGLQSVQGLPDLVGWVLAALLVVLPVVIMLGPVLAVVGYYYAILLTTLFHLPRRRAIVLSIVIALIAILPLTVYQLWAYEAALSTCQTLRSKRFRL